MFSIEIEALYLPSDGHEAAAASVVPVVNSMGCLNFRFTVLVNQCGGLTGG